MRMKTAGAGERSVAGVGGGGERPAREMGEHPRPLSVSCVGLL